MRNISIESSNTSPVPTLPVANAPPPSSLNSEETFPLTYRLTSVRKNDGALTNQNGGSSLRTPGYRILSVLKTRLSRSGDNATAENTEQAEVLSVGKALYLQAEALRNAQNKKERPQPLPLSLKGKTGFAMGAALMLTDAGLCLRRSNQYGRPDTRPLHTPEAGSVSSAMATPATPTYSFQNHSCRHDEAMKIRQHVRRHQPRSLPLTTALPETDFVRKEPLDFLCAKERQELSFSDVLRNIAETLKSPVKKLVEESQIVHTYNSMKKGCPIESDRRYLADIMHYIDVVANKVMSFFPEFVPIMILQNIIPPVLQSIADRADGKKMDSDLIMEMNNQLLTLPMLFASSLDLHGRNMLSEKKRERMSGIIPEKIKVKNGDIYVSISGGEFKMMRDEKGVYIYDIDRKSLQLRKKHIHYLRNSRRWMVGKNSKIMLPETGDIESSLERSQRLVTFARNESKKTDRKGSSVKFVIETLAKAGLIKKESLHLLQSKITQSAYSFNYIKDLTHITNENQLLRIKQGQVVIFTDTLDSAINVQHIMLATGNGMFAGINNERISIEPGFMNTIITAEQLGLFKNKLLTGREGKQFNVHAGFLKETQISLSENYINSVMELEEKAIKSDSTHAIASVLLKTGDLSPEFVSVLSESVGNINHLSKFIKSGSGWLSNEELAERVLPGEMIYLTDNLSGNYDKGTFALRLSKDEFFIPKLFDPVLESSVSSTIYKLSALEENIIERNLRVKVVEFNLAGTRTESLLGKDSRFYAVDNVLHVRAHGLPMTINYMSPLEIVSIIKGLCTIKAIDLNKISTIVLESCFGATGYPSTGKFISAVMNKRVIAYRGKYRTGHGAEEENRVIYNPTPLSYLENIVADITERNIDFMRKLRGVFTYFENTEREPIPSTSQRSKRDNSHFNLLLMDIGRLVLGKKDVNAFINDNAHFFNRNKGEMILPHRKILLHIPKNSYEFFEQCMELIYSNPDITKHLDFYISKTPIDNFDEDIYAQQKKLELRDKQDVARIIVNSITADLNEIANSIGISNVNKYISCKNSNEFGFPGEVYWDDKKKRFFVLLHEGIPANHYWNYPDDALDNDHWLYAGRHPGTLAQPKDWYEYGKAGCVYYEENYGYMMLKTDGRPSDYLWYFPHNGESSIHWQFIKWKAGTFSSPLDWNDEGISGNAYYYGDNDAFYIIKKTGNPSDRDWYFPAIESDNEHWIYAGKNRGNLDSPKEWHEYGQVGSIYYEKEYGYMMLKTDGRPSDKSWYFPFKGQSNNRWQFLCFEIGSFESPKLPDNEGLAGEVYYSIEEKTFYILRKDGKPSSHGWHFPSDEMDDGNWIYGGKNMGTLNSPKTWYDHGNTGSLYYEDGYGYLALKTNGRPSDHGWYFPYGGESDNHWTYISYAEGSFESPKGWGAKGKQGEVYYSDGNKAYYILRKQGKPSDHDWHFPEEKGDNENWLYAGENKGTLYSPKKWNEYGIAGSVYYDSHYGYSILKTEGKPYDNNWIYPGLGVSNDHWKFISYDVGTFDAPKKWNEEGVAGEVYYSEINHSFYILKNTGQPFDNGWHFPSGDNANWIYAGSHRGTLESPKVWNEYGKVGSVYYDAEYGYVTLKSEGRPSKNNWFYPKEGRSNAYWNFISWEAGTFEAPKRQEESGVAGEVYYSDVNQLFYLIKYSGNPAINEWHFPYGKADNENWAYAGEHKGTLDSPKYWSEYGKAGSIYYKSGHGYLILKTEGVPEKNKWYFPNNAESDNHWKFVSYEAGSFTAPKRLNSEGMTGDVYYSDEYENFYILRKSGNPANNGWYFSFDDDTNWFCAGKNKGTLDSTKKWNEYGKPGSLYYDSQYGFLTLKTEGRPSDHNWFFPDGAKSNEHWDFISYLAGSFMAPKQLSDKGVAGEIYYSHKLHCFFILKRNGTPSTDGWPFPSEKVNNLNWIYAGENKGTLDSPKHWNEYGKAGLIYYKADYGYLMLKTEGNPSQNEWYFPLSEKSNSHWVFIKR
ncbi:glucosyltransferase [Erwinia pyrifoliae]|uniref:glucosyltransferase n=1 Tax=Erwinia pyrifoliae TaxID=79967 RepID=UPI0021FAA745|nr:glucosyltransferase [Erwinia pyrifoliae]UWS29361.1 glucosyltransferase [Erwinia pyrifoliae]